MLDLARLEAIALRPRPRFQRLLGTVFLTPNYRNPLHPTNIRVEGLDRLPRGGGAVLVMNHTDRYNYWPFQYHLWRTGAGYTATWVKGKYYEHPALAWFMDINNNIPVPSLGYVLTKDFQHRNGRVPDDTEYAALREMANGRLTAEAAAERGGPAVRSLVLDGGAERGPGGYAAELQTRFLLMMERVVAISRSAVEMGLYLLIFPQGTRSRRLTRGHTGAAQFVLHTGCPVVPVGCSGSDLCYPKNSPWSRGGDIVYRIGDPLTAAELAPLRPPGPFVPFTASAAPYEPQFRALTDLLMDRINALVDPPYQYGQKDGQHDDEARGARRFV